MKIGIIITVAGLLIGILAGHFLTLAKADRCVYVYDRHGNPVGCSRMVK